MSPLLVASLLIGYFLILIVIAWYTSRGATSDSFFTGNKQSPWYLVAFGMIGTSLSGVTFISIPGSVLNEGMAYYQVVLGYILGYLVIAKVLMPMYYRLNLVSIYEFLNQRFGLFSYKTGAAFFILSRTLGSAMRLYLATVVLQLFLFDDLGVPYWVTSLTTVALIWVYTFKGGIRTIVYTDAFQTIFLVSAVIICTIVIANALGMDFGQLYKAIGNTTNEAGLSLNKMFFFDDVNSKLFFPKQFFGGMFIAIAMTGLDQDLMQKNLSCKSIGEAQKNMYSFTAIIVIVNFLFLLLGGALYVYANQKGVSLPMSEAGKVITDQVFPTLAFSKFGTLAGVFFLLGIIASSYASADSALAALTTGFCIDFLNFHRRDEKQKQRYKLWVHIGFSLIFLLIILLMRAFGTSNLISLVLTVASYTYGPLLGLFFFGILSKRPIRDIWAPVVCILAPLVCLWISNHAADWFNGYNFGYEILIVNGLLTYFGMFLISKPGIGMQPQRREDTLHTTPVTDLNTEIIDTNLNPSRS